MLKHAKTREFYQKAEGFWSNIEYEGDMGLKVEGTDTLEVVGNYGTPVFLYSKKQIIENVSSLRNAFKDYPNTIIAYSTKTNSNLSIMRILRDEGAYAEVCSGLDYHIAKKAGYKPGMVIYDGLAKQGHELENAIDDGVSIINVESTEELDKIDRIGCERGRTVSVGLRLGLGGVGASKFGFKALLGISYDRFGLDVDSGQAYDALKKAAGMKGLKIEGLHVHIGSNLRDGGEYLPALRKIVQFMSRIDKGLGIKVRYINLGGGFGVRSVRQYSLVDVSWDILRRAANLGSDHYLRDDGSTIDAMGRAITKELKRLCFEHSVEEPTLVLEPGRFIVGNSGILLMRILSRKKTHDGRIWLVADGGTNIVPNNILYNEYHQILPVEKKDVGCERVSISGPLMYGSDILAKDVTLPKLGEGDCIALMDAGAYMMALSHQLSNPRPCSVLVDGQSTRIIRGRETYDDVCANDVIGDGIF